MPLLAGRDFSREFTEDKMSAANKSRLSSAIINETAMRALGFADASAVIGQEVQSADPGFPERRHRVVGVVPDFPLGSVRNPVPPSIFIIDPDMFNVLNVKLSGSNLPETLRRLDAVWLEFVPERPINRVFLDDRIAGLYLDVTPRGRMFAAFAGFASGDRLPGSDWAVGLHRGAANQGDRHPQGTWRLHHRCRLAVDQAIHQAGSGGQCACLADRLVVHA